MKKSVVEKNKAFRATRKFCAVAALIIVACGLQQAQAQYSGFYGELFYGSGNTQFEFFNDLSDFDNDNDFYGITVGRTFNDNIAAEVSYVDFGNPESVISNPAIATLDAEIKARSLTISLLGTYPLSRSWVLSGKLGLNQWDLDASVTDNSASPPVTLSGEDQGSGFNYGVGLQYRLTPTYSIKISYQVYQLNPELFADDVVISGATVALRYNY